MNKLEFNEVIRVVNQGFIQIKESEFEGDNSYFLGDTEISFSGTYYAQVKGKIPLEFANMIYEKYPVNQYGIKIKGNKNNKKPVYFAKKIDAKEYIDEYHIEKQEGLLIFLAEMQNYILRNKSLPEIENFDDMIVVVNYNILQKVNPTISAFDWMQGDTNKDLYNNSLKRDASDETIRKYRDALQEFDKAINPFINLSLNTQLVKEYMNVVSISSELYTPLTSKDRENCCRLELTDLNTRNSTVYYRNPDGFAFKLKYKMDDGSVFKVSHYFSSNGRDEDKGETIAISYISDKKENNFDLRLNITNGMAGATYEEKNGATADQIDFVYEKLTEATEYAKSITNKYAKTKNI